MYAAMFRLELGGECSSRERGRLCRALAAQFAVLQGFVAFIALEAEDGAVGGLCICMDALTLEQAQQITAAWHGERDGAAQSPLSASAYVSGKVIVQHGF